MIRSTFATAFIRGICLTMILAVLTGCSLQLGTLPPLGLTRVDPGGNYGYSDPSWSPNDLEVVYVRYENTAHSQLLNSGEIFITDLTNMQSKQITHNNVEDRNPTWSPDGKAIAYIQEETPNIIQSGEQVITDTLRVITLDGLVDRAIYVCQFACSTPDWSPDGQQIVVSAASSAYTIGSGVPPTSDLLLIDAEGNNPIRLTSGGGHVSDPKWSPDGKQIAYIDPVIYRIHVVNVQDKTEDSYGSNDLRLGGYLTWSPDQTKIIFSGYEPNAGREKLYIFDYSTHEITHLFKTDIETLFWPESPDWSHDGRQILFTSARSEIYIANLNTLNIK